MAAKEFSLAPRDVAPVETKYRRVGTGCVLAPCHTIQTDTPVEDLIAVCDEAWPFKRF